MMELGGDLDFAQEAIGANRLGKLGTHHLDGDVAMMAQVFGQIDRCHTATTELALDAVTVREQGAQSIYWVRHSECDRWKHS